jgi:hypothetical protein
MPTARLFSRPAARACCTPYLRFLIVVAFGALCFGCGYLTAFIVTRNKWRDEMIKRGVARYNWNNRRLRIHWRK